MKKSRRRPAKVAQMLAMAHHLQSMIDRGEIRDRAELARRLGISRARVTQILDMTLLAPGIQEEVLFMEAVDGKEPISERQLRGRVGGQWSRSSPCDLTLADI